MSPVIWSGRGLRGGWSEKKKGAGRMRGINDRETLISGPSGDFLWLGGHYLDVGSVGNEVGREGGHEKLPLDTD